MAVRCRAARVSLLIWRASPTGGVGLTRSGVRAVGRKRSCHMTKQNWTKWAAGAAVAALALVAMPAVGQARHYTGRTPASITPATVTLASTHHTAVKTASQKHTKLAA